MPKYVLIYRGGSVPDAPDDLAAHMRAWRAWVGELGAAVLDPGNPLGPALTVAADGAIGAGTPVGLRGYMILAADSLDAAAAIARGCPQLAPRGNATADTVEVYEALPIG